MSLVKVACQKFPRFREEIKGSALVELSLALPLLVVFVGFIGEFSRVVYQYHIADKGVKSAARYLARVPDVSTCSAASFDGFKTNAVNMAQRGSFNAGEPLVLSNWNDAGDIQISVSCVANPVDPNTQQTPYFGPPEIPVITVSTSFQFNDIGLLNVIKVLNADHEDRGTISISASHKEVYVGD